MAGVSIVHIGRHRCWFEPPDIFVTQWHGEVTVDHMRAVYEAIDPFAAVCPAMFVLSDMTHSGIPGAEARKLAAHDPRNKLTRAMAIVGANFHVRVVATMLFKAMKFVGKGDEAPIAFFALEIEARQWLEEQRRMHRRSSVV